MSSDEGDDDECIDDDFDTAAAVETNQLSRGKYITYLLLMYCVGQTRRQTLNHTYAYLLTNTEGRLHQPNLNLSAT